ncbi:MAG: glycoside hydrolase family 32 protein [Bacteroidales bacterium]|nr:glycoside hydrolase family 32 protein [Bacteroidales bacterium]
MNIHIKKSSLVLFVITFLSISNVTNAQFYPHDDNIDYKEDYRPQFHFSPKSEWMNDINALIYQDGTYHMLYQWGKKVRHGGYATSTDLIHWEDKGVALIPENSHIKHLGAKTNVSGGGVFSGSGVFVEGEVAEKITGSSKPALVTHYTGTRVGTCIAWSNDGGATWHNYKNNPVAHPTDGTVPRDPCVIWYEPTKSWILGIFTTPANKAEKKEKAGTIFYGSKDLINWDKLSFINFGHECPDLVELPLDGDTNNMKWVLSDAAGSYLVGQFDGKKFNPEDETPRRMDVGPDFYGSQTFFPHNMPEKKVIQIGWNDRWNGGVAEKWENNVELISSIKARSNRVWERNATFPVELGLITYEGKPHVTRTPIAAISKLYTNTTMFADKTLTPGNNILSGIKSKAFDMTAEFDLNNTTAKTITFTIANKSYTYKIAEQKLVGRMMKKKMKNGELIVLSSDTELDLKPDADGKLKIRMLIDWSNIEIFANKGVFSYSEHFALDPKANNVEIIVDGDVKLTSLEFNQIKSIW